MAMSGNDRDEHLSQLADVLDLYGARQERWPEAARARLSAFVTEDEAAARLLAEARALERLLALAAGGGATDALEARILAAAGARPQRDGAAAPAFQKSDGRNIMPIARPASPVRRIWPELTLLAASLFLGLLIGLSGQVLPTLQNVALIADEDGFGTLAGLLFDPGGGPEQGAL
jgi:hypothetical protein